MYTTGDVTRIFNVSRQTISNWCHEFADHLSPTATPTVGSHRRFTNDDVSVLSLISTMKEMGSTYEDIQASLRSGQRGQVPETETTALALASETRLAELEVLVNDLVRERDELRIAKATSDALLQRAESRLQEEQARHERQLAEAQARNEKLLLDAQAEIARLNREIGRLTKD